MVFIKDKGLARNVDEAKANADVETQQPVEGPLEESGVVSSSSSGEEDEREKGEVSESAGVIEGASESASEGAEKEVKTVEEKVQV